MFGVSSTMAVRQAQKISMLWLYGGSIDQWLKEHNSESTTSESLNVLGLRGGAPVDGWKRLLIY